MPRQKICFDSCSAWEAKFDIDLGDDMADLLGFQAAKGMLRLHASAHAADRKPTLR